MIFSVVLIAKNESKTLPRLMESLSEFRSRGGKILLLDTGSTDNTAQIAKDLGCEVHEVGEKFVKVIDAETAEAINKDFVAEGEEAIVRVGEKLFDYSAARNYIAEFAPTDMIATPDCDEVYTKLDLDKVQELIASGVDQLEYSFVFAHNPDGSEGLKFMHCKFYNRKKLTWHRIVHEVLVPIEGSAEAHRQFVGEDVVKLEHWQNPETNRSGYLRGLALDCFLDRESDRNLHYFARELMWTGRLKSALRVFERHVAMANAWRAEQGQSYVFMGDCYKMLGDRASAVSMYHKAFDLDAGRRESLMRLAELYFEENDYMHTAHYATAALMIPNSNYYANNQRHYGSLPHELLYWAHWYLGNKQESRKHWEQAFLYEPFNLKYLDESKFYINLPKVSVIVPHMGKSEERVAGLKRCLASIEALDYTKELLETITLEDTLENRLGVPKRVAEGLSKSSGDIIVYAANDMEFHPASLKIAVLYSIVKEKGLVAFNAGPVSPDEGNICEHFLIQRSLIPQIGGEIFDTEFHHVGVDNLLWAKCKKLGQADRCEAAVINHYHFSKGAPMDDVYRLGWQEKDHDRALLEKKLKELNENIHA